MSTAAAAHRFIRRPDELAEVVTALEAAPWIAVDSESNSMFVYREQVCLLQLNAGGALFVVDPLALGVTAATTPSLALAALRPALSKGDRPLWVHGGEYDAAVLRRDFAFDLGGLFDTQQAASLLGWTKTGYGSLAQEICGVTLSKQYATYDWATRPLLPDALTYAVDDVVHLPVIAETLRAAVKKADIEDEVAVANAVVASSVWTTHFDPERMWRIKEIEALDDNGLRALVKLYTWRNEAALAEDLPPGRMVNDEVLKWLARHRPKSLEELRQAKLKSAIVARHGQSLVEAIASAQSEPVPTKPVTVRPPAAIVAREERYKAWRRQEAERRQAAEGRPIPLQLVLPSRALEHLKLFGADDLTQVPQLGARRIERYGEALQKLARGGAAPATTRA